MSSRGLPKCDGQRVSNESEQLTCLDDDDDDDKEAKLSNLLRHLKQYNSVSEGKLSFLVDPAD